MKTLTCLFYACACAAALVATTVVADDAVRLTRDEVQTLVAGNALKYARADGTVVTWDVRKDGSLYYTPTKTQRAVTVSGTWSLDDSGAFCTKWNDEKYVTMTDGCYLFVRDGDRMRMTGKRNPDRVVGELVR